MEKQSPMTAVVHKFTIKNYNCIYFENYKGPTVFQSEEFSVSINDKIYVFFIRLYPNGKLGYISLFLHLLKGPNVNIKCSFKTNIHKTESTTKVINEKLTRHNYLEVIQYIKNNSKFRDRCNYLFEKTRLSINCEIEIFDQTFPGSSMPKIDKPKSKSADAEMSVCTFEYEWPINEFKSAYKSGHDIFKNFLVNSSKTLSFKLQVCPKGQSTNEDSKDHVSVHLCRGHCDNQEPLIVQMRISIVDVNCQKINQKWFRGELNGSNGFGCDQYIDCKTLFDQKHKWLPKNTLTLNCKIEYWKSDRQKQIFPSNNLKIKNCNLTLSNSLVLNASSAKIIGNLNISS